MASQELNNRIDLAIQGQQDVCITRVNNVGIESIDGCTEDGMPIPGSQLVFWKINANGERLGLLTAEEVCGAQESKDRGPCLSTRYTEIEGKKTIAVEAVPFENGIIGKAEADYGGVSVEWTMNIGELAGVELPIGERISQKITGISDELMLAGVSAVAIIGGLIYLKIKNNQRTADRERAEEKAWSEQSVAQAYNEELKKINDYGSRRVNININDNYIMTDVPGPTSTTVKNNGKIVGYAENNTGLLYGNNARGFDQHEPIEATQRTERGRRSNAETQTKKTLWNAANDRSLSSEDRNKYATRYNETYCDND